jgi:aminoglycoside phosphotransferase (APT) family kinase protein
MSQALLRHLQSVGFEAMPRFLGLDPEGREILSFLPGEVPSDLGHYDDQTLHAAAALLRRFHDATADFPPVRAAGAEVMCHNDWGPPNAVFSNGTPAGIIDFDTVKPGLRLWDLGYSAFSWLDLGDDDYSGDEQIRRLQVFADGYGMAEYSVPMLATFALARQATLAAAGRARGKHDLADWAQHCADWTTANITEKLLPTGMMPAAGG